MSLGTKPRLGGLIFKSPSLFWCCLIGQIRITCLPQAGSDEFVVSDRLFLRKIAQKVTKVAKNSNFAKF
jgi:hypothetical protein